MAHTHLSGMPLELKTVPPSIEMTIERIIDYIEQRHSVSFSDIHHFMEQENLRFGANTNAIDILDLEAYRTRRIDVNYTKGMIYSRQEQTPPPPPQRQPDAETRPRK